MLAVSLYTARNLFLNICARVCVCQIVRRHVDKLNEKDYYYYYCCKADVFSMSLGGTFES